MTQAPSLPPFPDAWLPLTITATPDGKGGAEGVLSIGPATYILRGWHRAASGVLKGEVQAPRDAAFEEYMDRVLGKVQG